MMFLIHAVDVMQITKKVFRRPILSKQRHVLRLICECFELCRSQVVHPLTARRRTSGCGIAGIPALGLAWMGEIAALVPVKTMALLGRLFRDEASVLAWQDYILFNGLVVLVALLPALLTEVRFWQPAQAKVDAPEADAELAVQDVPDETESPARVEADTRTPAPSRI
jgi:hypothetical protein